MKMMVVAGLAFVLIVGMIIIPMNTFAAETERKVTVNLDGIENVFSITTYNFARRASIHVDEKMLNDIDKEFGITSFIFRNQISVHGSGDSFVKIEPRVSFGAEIQVEFISSLSKSTPLASKIDSPKKQLDAGVAAEDVECETGKTLMLRGYITAACVKPSNAKKLVDLGWGIILNEMSMENITIKSESMREQRTVMDLNGMFPESMIYTKQAPSIDPEKGYFVDEIADGLFWLTGSGYQVMFLTTGEGVIVTDAPQPLGEKYIQAIREVTDKPITHMIYSHSHPDHTGAAGKIFPADIEYIAHKDTADILASENDPNRPIPTITFDDMYTLSVGNQVLELHYIGPFHSKGDIVINAPRQKVLMAVDLFHPGAAPYRAFGVTVNLDEHIKAHDTLVNEFDFDVLVSGHEQILGTKDHIKTDKEFVLSVKENIRKAIQTVSLEEVIQTCVDVTIEQWDGKLGDIEQFMPEHCAAMMEYVSSQ